MSFKVKPAINGKAAISVTSFGNFFLYSIGSFYKVSYPDLGLVVVTVGLLVGLVAVAAAAAALTAAFVVVTAAVETVVGTVVVFNELAAFGFEVDCIVKVDVVGPVPL